MIFLILAVVLSSYLVLAFKLLEKFDIPLLPSIVFNYIFCVITGALWSGTLPFSRDVVSSDWLKWALLTGLLFIGLFNIIGLVTQKMGVSVSSVANKLSMIIAVVVFIIFFKDAYNWIKLLGVVVAVAAVILTSYKNTTSNKIAPIWYVATIVLFIGSGLLDTLFKWVSDRFLYSSEAALNQYLITAFSTAAVVGVSILCFQYFVLRKTFTWKALLAGAAIGIPNYFSIYFLGKVYDANLMESSAIIPVVNMSIVLFSTVVSFLIFKERLTRLNWLGILMAAVSIAMIGFSNKLF
jgi:drug/metabolite transporter (DMT)-like permease